MKYYNVCVYDKRYNLVHNAVVDVDADGNYCDVFCDMNYVPEIGDFDCKGNVLYPSFMDCAVTLPGKQIFRSVGLDLSRYNRPEQYINLLRGYDMSKSIRAYGYNHMVLNGTGVETIKSILDEQCPGAPAYVLSDDLTTVIVNEFILNSVGDLFDVDESLHRSGELDYIQMSKLKVYTDFFDFTVDEITVALLSFQQQLLENGITKIRVIDSIGGWNVIEAVQRLEKAGKWFILTVFNAPIYPFMSQRECWDVYARYLQMENRNLYVIGVTLTLDGSVDSMQAALSRPYVDSDDWKGTLLWGMSALRRTAEMFITNGIDVNIRAHGDAAFGMAVDALSGYSDIPSVGKRFITHAYLVSEVDARLCARHDITVCIEPTSIPYMDSFYDGDVEMLGDRVYSLYPVGSVMYSGVRVIAGSNYPVEDDIFPMHGVFKATHRVSEEDTTVFSVLQSYGSLACKSFNLFTITGSVAVGKRASFVLLNKDIIHMNESQLMDVSCMSTIVDGKVMYSR